jgi:ammonium transporter, Amt family
VSGMSAIVIGFLAGGICLLAIGIKRRFRFDDALDVIAVHLVGGITGSLLLGFFADKTINPLGADGVFNGGGAELLGNQLVAVMATIVFSFVVSFTIAKVIDMTMGLRVDEAAENEGLDITQHAETAYA